LGKIENAVAVDQISLQFIGAAPAAGVLLKDIFFTTQEPLPEKTSASTSPNKKAFPDPVFPEFRDLTPDLRIPKNAAVTVDKDGNYVVDGKVRFFLGTQLETELATGFQHRSGYDEKHHWIYDLPPDYERALRLGFDSLGFFTPSTWTRKYNPKAFTSGSGTLPDDEKAFDAFVKNSSLPLYVDMTCFPWAHGILSGKNGPASDEAKSSPLKNHFLPYSIVHPDGVALYKEMAAAIAKRVLENGGAPLFYELFNEPGYTDDNAYNRGVFAAWLAAKYKTISKLNEVWASRYASFEEIGSFKSASECLGLYVDWCKFFEFQFTRLTLETKAAVRAVDTRKDARFTVQVMGMNYYRKLPATGVNLYEVLKNMEVVSTPTGGGIGKLGVGLTTPPAHTIEAGNLTEKEGIAMARFLRAISEGKPIHDGEFYGPNDSKDLVNAWWLEIARGYSASYLFKWDKRAWDWKDEKEGRKKAEQYDYLWRNPYAKSTSTFPGILTFKKEFKTVEDLIVPKARNVKTEIAVLLSFPTERASDINLTQHNEILSYAGALEFSHFPYDVIPEEEIHGGKLSRYKVLILAGVRNLYPETVPFLEKFISEGGLIVMAFDLPAFDEYDHPLPWSGVSGLELGGKLKSDSATLSMKIPQWAFLPGQIKALPFKELRATGEWDTLASVGGGTAGKAAPVVVSKKIGKGSAVFIDGKFSDYALTAMLGSLLNKEGISRPLEASDAASGELPPNVEIHAADHGAEKMVFLFNWDLYSKLVYLKTPGLPAASASDPLSHERYEVSEKG
ncbi:MAG: beta-galactosidase, partial [Spirochaetia bacterium]|nr:beta-galactosidase [Spirochaetia bacterium]